MTIDTADIFGSDQIGIHVASIGQYVFHPPELTKPVKEKIDSVIGLESVELSIGGSNLIGQDFWNKFSKKNPPKKGIIRVYK